MSEMLGNQYFMTRNYARAIPQFETVLEEENNNMNCRKKLVISHIRMGNYEKALSYFMDIMDIDPNIIINTEPEKDDCPCPEIVEEMKREYDPDHPCPNLCNQLAMLYLYCDIQRSISYFQKSLALAPNQLEIMNILIKLRAVASLSRQNNKRNVSKHRE